MFTALAVAAAIATSSLPAPPTRVILAPCPAGNDAAGCTYQTPTSPVWIDPKLGTGWALYHELGHRVAFTLMTPGDLHRFGTLTLRHGPISARDERIADAYATCSDRELPLDSHTPAIVDVNFPTPYGYNPYPRQQHRVCAFFAHIMRRAGYHLARTTGAAAAVTPVVPDEPAP